MVREIARGLDDMFHVDPEHLTVFKPVQGVLSRFVCFGAMTRRSELFPEGRLRLDQGCIPVFREQRKEVVVLASEKILPQEIAGAEQLCEQRKYFFIADEVERLALAVLALVFHDEIQELVERCQCLRRVGGPGQGMRELFDEHGGQPQLLLIGGVEQFLSIAIPDKETIVQLVAVAFDLGLGNVNVAHGQGIRKRIEEGRSIIRSDVHDRVCRGLAIVEGDLHRIEQAGKGTPLLVQSLDKPAVDVLACLVEPTGIQQLNDLADRLSEGIVLRYEKACAVYGMHEKDINDFFAAEARPAFRPASHRRAPPAPRRGGCGPHKGIDPSFFDIEPEG